MKTTYLSPLLLALTLGCSAADPAASTPVASTQADLSLQPAGPRAPHRHGTTVMTRNVYFGFDENPLVGAPPEIVPALVAQAWAQMERNDFTERAGALADEIAKTLPDIAGLQEMMLLRRFPYDGGATSEIDFVSILEAALVARGLDYQVRVVQKDSEMLAPLLVGFGETGEPLLDYVDMQDREVILARADVTTSGAASGRYAAAVAVPIGGTDVEKVRGWASVVARTAGGETFRFVSTHLEEPSAAGVQQAQAAELVDLLKDEALPVVLVGDFNASSGTATYDEVAAAGYLDAWPQAHPRTRGYTCCEPADLSESAPLDQRIDLVWVRERAPARRIPGDVDALLVGEAPRDRTPSGLWPSDHAGLVVSLRILPASCERAR